MATSLKGKSMMQRVNARLNASAAKTEFLLSASSLTLNDVM
jgi:hypothetical protein